MIVSGKTIVILALALAVLGACSTGGPSGSNEAGRQVDEGHFGNPTYNNILLQTAYRNQNGLLMDLSRKFEKDVPSMVNFAFNSARLDAQSRAILRQQADWIKQFPEIKFRVYGHTDLVGTDAYNKRLGLRRANRVVGYLVSRGVSGRHLQAVVSFGETQPLIVTEGRERRNRRTVTEVIGFARNYIGDDLDGKYARLVYRTYIVSPSGAAAAKPTN